MRRPSDHGQYQAAVRKADDDSGVYRAQDLSTVCRAYIGHCRLFPINGPEWGEARQKHGRSTAEARQKQSLRAGARLIRFQVPYQALLAAGATHDGGPHRVDDPTRAGLSTGRPRSPGRGARSGTR